MLLSQSFTCLAKGQRAKKKLYIMSPLVKYSSHSKNKPSSLRLLPSQNDKTNLQADEAAAAINKLVIMFPLGISSNKPSSLCLPPSQI